MKRYMIEVVPKFEQNPTQDDFDVICAELVTAVDNLCNNNKRSFHVMYPLQEDIDKGNYHYRIHILVNSESELRSSTLFDLLNTIHPLVLINLQESRFCMRAGDGVHWYHEGETTYYDGGTYTSPNYDLYINGKTHYTVQYVPLAIRSMYDRDKKRYEGVTYMWRCTGCWDNFMRATTLDEALLEFEDYYHKLLWKAVESTRKSLAEAEDNFRQFGEYQLQTRCKKGYK